MSIWDISGRLLLAIFSGALIGLERGRFGKAAGLRTHMLVALGSAMTSIVGIYLTGYGSLGDPSRIASGVVSGMGFIGAGIIIVRGSSRITGLTTAAAMWATASVGLAYGAGMIPAGAVGTLIILMTLIVLPRLEISQKAIRAYFIEIDDAYETNRVIDEVKNRFPDSHGSDVVPSRSGIPNHVGIVISIKETAGENEHSVVSGLKQIKNVVFAVKE